MRLLPLLTHLLLPLGAIAAKKEPKDRFTTAIAKSTPLKLSDSSYNALTKAPRDYSVAVLLTAMGPQFGCHLCQQFQPEWELLARSWTRGDKKQESRLVFGTLDFSDGKGVFQSLQLQTAPVLLLFPPTTGPHARTDKPFERLDFNTGISRAEPAHAFLARFLPAPPFTRPINYIRIATLTTAILGLLTFLVVASPYLLPVLQSRNLWAALSLILVLLFTSGHMFNHIRKVPYAQPDGKGGLNYFAGGFQSQFGLETQIVAAIYGVLSFATISLALKVPRIADRKQQQVAVFVWGGVLLCVYSFLLSVFRIKNGGYPFWLPPF